MREIADLDAIGLLQVLEFAFVWGILLGTVGFGYQLAVILRCGALQDVIKRCWSIEDHRDALLFGSIRIGSVFLALTALRWYVAPRYQDQLIPDCLDVAPALTRLVLCYMAGFSCYSVVRLVNSISETRRVVNEVATYDWCRRILGSAVNVLAGLSILLAPIRLVTHRIHRGLVVWLASTCVGWLERWCFRRVVAQGIAKVGAALLIDLGLRTLAVLLALRVVSI